MQLYDNYKSVKRSSIIFPQLVVSSAVAYTGASSLTTGHSQGADAGHSDSSLHLVQI